MLDLDRSTWQRLSPLLDQALALPAAERTAWLQALPAEHADLRDRLRELLLDRPEAGWTLPPLDDAADDEPWAAGQTVGSYRLLRPLGRGGMGTVWLARRDDLPRPVALKLPRVGAAGRRLAERMARERDLLAALEHPHIARLYDAGLTDDGQPFLALEYVSGRPIDAYCRERALDTPARLALFLQVAQAVAHAHAQLIVHRDLKPSNLLVSDQGEVKLLDFGIAKMLEPGTAAEGLTRADALPMTPEYAAPEQVAGQAVDTRADVYALGVLLFELLTGQRPYRLLRVTAAAVEEAIVNQVPPRPSEAVRDRRLARALRGDLDVIVGQALKKNPADRYPTVQALADDIGHHLAHRPVLARADSPGYVLRRLMRRHRLRFAAAGVALAGVLAGTALAAWQAHRADLERQRAAAVGEFLARLLRDAGPYRSTAGDWRSQRLLARLLRSTRAGSGDVQQVTAVDLLQQAGRQLDGGGMADAQTRAQLRRVVAEGLAAFGDLAQAESLADRALADAVQRLGTDHPQTLRLRLTRVFVKRYQADTEAVGRALAELLPLLRAQAGRDPEALVLGLQLAAVQALDQASPAEALQAVDEAEAWLPRLAEARGERLGVLLLRARAQRLAGRHADSREAAAEAVTLARALHGQGPHPNHIEALFALARAATALGDLSGALQHHEAALDQARRLLGADSPFVAFLLQGMVPLQLELGADELAERHGVEAVRIVALHLKPGTYVRAASALAHAQVLLHRDLGAAALAQVDEALPTVQRILGPTHPQTVSAQLLRARALALLGRHAEARQALPEQAVGATGSAQAPDDGADGAPLALRAATVRALLARAEGDAGAAFTLMSSALAEPGAGRHWQLDRALAHRELALALEALARPAEARTQWLAVLALSRQAHRSYTRLATAAGAALERLPK
jgi:tetratricopeptide (TPR) repeat protein